MEFRTIQSVNGSDFSIALPKRWLYENKIGEKDRVYFEYNRKSLIIRPEIDLKVKSEINFKKCDPFNLKREIIALYLMGTDEIAIKEEINQEVLNIVEEITKTLVGLEIYHDSEKIIILKYNYNLEQFYFIKAINEMIELSNRMLTYTIEAFSNNNKEIGKFVIDLDKEVNKIYFHIGRNYNKLLEGRMDKESRFSSLLEIKYYEFLSIQLERIADHVVKIAGVIVHQDLDKMKSDALLYENLFKKFPDYLDALRNLIADPDNNKAHKIIESLENLEKKILTTWAKLGNAGSKESVIILDSLNRLKGYLVNISERIIFQHFIEK